jgi:hypothetical protein
VNRLSVSTHGIAYRFSFVFAHPEGLNKFRPSYSAGGPNLAADLEKRRSPRVEVSWPITILAETGTIEGEIRNVSVDGLLIFCEEPLRLNETYRMSILPGKHHAIGVSGKVVWADAYCMDEENTAFGVGVCLVELTDEDREALRALIAGARPSSAQKP